MLVAKIRQYLGVELIQVSVKERLVATLGGGLAILILLLATHWALPAAGATAVVASMGASAVLLFAVPHGPLSQPWPVIAGHVLSAIVGVACAQLIAPPILACACAVGLAIGVMHLCKCIHPPGGATAFTAVMGGNAIHDLGFGFVLFPVLTNALIMVVLAVLINNFFSWRRYPSSLNRPRSASSRNPSPAPSHAEIVAAMQSMDSFIDISEEDLTQLVTLLRPQYTQIK